MLAACDATLISTPILIGTLHQRYRPQATGTGTATATGTGEEEEEKDEDGVCRISIYRKGDA